MLRFLRLAVLLACVSAFVPPATLAQRSVVGRAASVEMGASKGNINLLKKPKAAPKKAAAKVRRLPESGRADLSFAGHRRRRRHLLARIRRPEDGTDGRRREIAQG